MPRIAAIACPGHRPEIYLLFCWSKDTSTSRLLDYRINYMERYARYTNSKHTYLQEHLLGSTKRVTLGRRRLPRYA